MKLQQALLRQSRQKEPYVLFYLRAVSREIPGQTLDDGLETALSVKAFQDFDGDRVWLQDALGPQEYPATPRCVFSQPYPPSQLRNAVGPDLTGHLVASPGRQAPGGGHPGST